MKKAIVTITIGDKYKHMAKITHPKIKAYAKRIGADFIVWKDFRGHSLPAYKKLDIGDLLNTYDRVCFLDTDLLVRDDCPDLFDIVPEECFGAFNEFPFTDRTQAMYQYRPNEEWIKKAKYYNTGVFVCSKAHKQIFNIENEVNNFYEQTALNFNLYNLDIPTYDLSYKFNRMTCMEGWGYDRHDSYIIHYAGCPIPEKDMFKHMKTTLKTWKRSKQYKQCVHFDVNGGLGDQVCAEPVIRYLNDTEYKDCNVRVSTNYPELFDHLDVEIYKKGHKERSFISHEYNIILPPASRIGLINNHILTHPVDACSLAAFKGQMHPEQKTIKLAMDEYSLIGERVSDSIVIHPGRSWPSKTLPKEFWLDLIDDLTSHGFKVTIVGKHINDEFGYVDLGTIDNKLVNDLRDKLTLKELISVIGCAKHGLISNDSAPIHIAGAFDHPIHLITMAKADFRILPFRHGSQNYKAFSYGKLIQRPFASNHIGEVRVDKVDELTLKAHMPNVEEITNNVIKEMEHIWVQQK